MSTPLHYSLDYSEYLYIVLLLYYNYFESFSNELLNRFHAASKCFQVDFTNSQNFTKSFGQSQNSDMNKTSDHFM